MQPSTQCAAHWIQETPFFIFLFRFFAQHFRARKAFPSPASCVHSSIIYIFVWSERALCKREEYLGVRAWWWNEAACSKKCVATRSAPLIIHFLCDNSFSWPALIKPFVIRAASSWMWFYPHLRLLEVLCAPRSPYNTQNKTQSAALSLSSPLCYTE